MKFLQNSSHCFLQCTQYQDVSIFVTYWKDNNIPNIKKKQNKLDELTDMIGVGQVLSLSLQSPSVVTSIQYTCHLYDDNKLGSSMNELRCRMFTKKNLSRDRLPQTLDALVLHLRRPLIFFINIYLIFFSEIFFIYQKYKI